MGRIFFNIRGTKFNGLSKQGYWSTFCLWCIQHFHNSCNSTCEKEREKKKTKAEESHNSINRIAEPYKAKIKEKIVIQMIKILTTARPIAANRIDFYAAVEIFSFFVHLELLQLPGIFPFPFFLFLLIQKNNIGKRNFQFI